MIEIHRGDAAKSLWGDSPALADSGKKLSHQRLRQSYPDDSLHRLSILAIELSTVADHTRDGNFGPDTKRFPLSK